MTTGPDNRRILECIVDDAGEVLFVTRETLRYVVEGREYTVPIRYLSDGFSLPKPLKPLFRKLFLRKPMLIFAAIFHDWTNDIDADYDGDRWNSDADFKRLMKHYKMPFIYRELFYAGVRVGSWKVWKRQYMRIQPPKA